MSASPSRRLLIVVGLLQRCFESLLAAFSITPLELSPECARADDGQQDGERDPTGDSKSGNRRDRGIEAVAVFVDPVVRDVHGVWIDGDILVVAVRAGDERKTTVGSQRVDTGRRCDCL